MSCLKELRRSLWSAVVLGALFTSATPATAQVIRDHSKHYWIGHSLLIGGFVVGGAIARASFDETVEARSYPEPRSWAVSDALYGLELILPLPALATGNNSENFGHGLLVYGETLAGAYGLQNLSRATGYGGTRAVVAFAGATMASALFRETKSAPRAVTYGFGGLEFALAAVSVVSRYQGTHPDQQWQGVTFLEGLVGTAAGMGLYALNGVRREAFFRGEVWGMAAGGTLVGYLVGLALAGWTPDSAVLTLNVSPLVADAPGVTLSGVW